MADAGDRVEETARALGVVALYLHGSRAAGCARPDSDIDLAVLVPRGWSAARFEEAAYRLARSVGERFGTGPEAVDAQDLGCAPAEFRARVVATGRLLFVGDATALARFQACSFSQAWDEKIHLEPIRRAMRQRIREGRFAS